MSQLDILVEFGKERKIFVGNKREFLLGGFYMKVFSLTSKNDMEYAVVLADNIEEAKRKAWKWRNWKDPP